MLNYPDLLFRNRQKPISFPVSEADANRLLNYISDRSEPLEFFELRSLLQQSIWINTNNIQMIYFLEEVKQLQPLPFDPSSIGLSKQYPDKEKADEHIDYDDISWHITFWLQGQPKPVRVSTTGSDWDRVYTACDAGEQFVVLTDEDEEELAIRVADIDMISGIEVERYSEEQLDKVIEAIRS